MSVVMPNGNVRSFAPPRVATIAWDWPSIEEGSVRIWRGTWDHQDLILDIAPTDPAEAADWLEALASAVRQSAEFFGAMHVPPDTDEDRALEPCERGEG